jgi:hypothetical protein
VNVYINVIVDGCVQGTKADSKAVVARKAGTVATQRPNQQGQGQTMLAPKGELPADCSSIIVLDGLILC